MGIVDLMIDGKTSKSETPGNLAMVHPLMKIAEKDILVARSPKEKHAALTNLVETKHKITNFYRWSRKEWKYKWGTRLFCVGLAWYAYGVWDQTYRTYHIFDNGGELYKAKLSRDFEELRSASIERRRRIVSDVASFSHSPAFPRLSATDIGALRDRITAYCRPRMVSAVEVWEEELAEIEELDIARRAALERAKELQGERYASKRILRDGVSSSSALEPLQQPDGWTPFAKPTQSQIRQ